MSKNKNKPQEAKGSESTEQSEAPSVMEMLQTAFKELKAIEPGHREIDIAATDACKHLLQAIDLVKFIDSAKAPKKK